MRTDGCVEIDGVKVHFRRSRVGKVMLVVGGIDRLNIGCVEVTESVVRAAFSGYRRGLYDGDVGNDDKLAGTPFESTERTKEDADV